MKQLFLLLCLGVLFGLNSAHAQNREFRNAIQAKLNAIDYGLLAGNDLKVSQGFEFGYYRNVAPFLNIGVPFKLSLGKLPNTEGNTVTTSFDLIFRLENLKPGAKAIPFAFGGAGYSLEGFSNGHLQIPFGGGVSLRLSPYAFINIQAEYRKALIDDRDNIQLGVGYVYLLHKTVLPKPLPADTDKDGTPDSLDLCPTLAGTATALGCPDRDNDGVADQKDNCPDEAGPQGTNGCPDYDNDGFADAEDDCPTDAGALKGCPDTDNDGFADSVDECPTVAGTWKGCPDTDNDGISDQEDKCPNEPGPIAQNGCPQAPAEKDSDNDGFADSKDECPDVSGPLNGCPDADNDGVADAKDECPNAAGPLNGCPDADNDGVADAKDECPNAAGPLNGCPDADNDGVADKNDPCPNAAGPLKGCPDADNDGIADADDKCPTEAGNAQNQGCPDPGERDTDKDGFSDKQDECPEIAGTINGCPDKDNDGFADNKDRCPDQAGTLEGCPDRDNDRVADIDDACPGIPGLPELKGCPPAADRDGDGIADEKDLCPDKAGKFSGCPDSDGDGLPDHKDKCPETKGDPANNGCPIVKQETKDQLAAATKNVQFESGKAKLKQASYAVLDEVVLIMRQYPDYTLSISGHTDNVGDEETNLKLSQDRAKACYDYLVFRGIKPERLRHAGFGDSLPVADNNTPEGREQNRRVAFELVLEK